DRRLHVDEPVGVEEIPQRLRYTMAQAEVVEHRLAAQVEVAVLEPQLLVRMLVVVKRGRRGLVQRRQFFGQQLHLARRHVRVDRAFGTVSHPSCDLEHVFASQALGFGEDLGAIRIEHDLQQAFTVAQVDENDTPMVTTAVHPTGDSDLFADECLVNLSAIVAAHEQIRGSKGAECYGVSGGNCKAPPRVPMGVVARETGSYSARFMAGRDTAGMDRCRSLPRGRQSSRCSTGGVARGTGSLSAFRNLSRLFDGEFGGGL